MHLFSKQHRFFGGQGIVGAGIPHAVGLALAAKAQNERRLTFVFFGDGAVAEGEFHESMNLASLWKLPVLFCCENNLYAMGTALDRHEAQINLTEKAKGYKMASISIDGMNVDAVVEGTRQAINHTLAKQQPIFIEFRTYRFRPHSMFDPELYRSKEEVADWKKRCPIENKKAQLITAGFLTNELFQKIETDAQEELTTACEFAEQSPLETADDLMSFVYAPGGSL